MATTPPVAAQSANGSVSGIVDVTGPDQQPFVVPGVTLTLTCPVTTDGSASPLVRVVVTDADGSYRFDDVPPGQCSIVGEMQGFQSAKTSVSVGTQQNADVSLRLGFDTLRENVTVTGNATTALETTGAATERVEAKTLQTAPIANERFQDALPLIPGVVRGPDGLLNINGSRSNQTGLTVNNAGGTDPVTGEFALEVPIDAIQSVQVQQTAYAPEYGQSSGAMASVETAQGGDKWRVQFNNFMPRIRDRGGKIVGLESFTPRLTLGGPIVAGRLSAIASAQYTLTRTPVESLPPLERDTEVEGVDTFTRFDWKANDTNHVNWTGIVSPRTQRYAGLNTFNPQTVTPSIDTDGYLVSGGDSIVLRGNGVFDTRVSYKQFDVNVYPSQIGEDMVLAPDVNGGSFFNSQDRTSRRVEWLNTYSVTPASLSSHLFKFGAGATYESFDGVSTSRPVDIVDANGTLLEQMRFVGDGDFGRHRVAVSIYAQDAWTLGARLTAQYGVRADRDSATSDMRAAPRFSFTALATSDGRTIVRGGVGLFQAFAPLNVLAFNRLQSRVISDFTDGEEVVTVVDNHIDPDIRMGSSVNWNLQLDREWAHNFFVRFGYRQREGRNEPILHTIDQGDGRSFLDVSSNGESTYREGQVTARYTFRGDDQVVASYTRSSSQGDLNSFNSYFANIYNPIVPDNERGPLPWDAPNRVLIWASLSLPYGLDAFPVLDIRNGFPLSDIDALREFVGPRNEAGRFPTFASFDIQVVKKIRLFGHNQTVGLKIFNITDHFNPRDYFGNIDGARYGTFANGVGRTFRAKWVVDF